MGRGTLGRGKRKRKGEEGYIPPPDGGWGWVVVLASFIVNVITDGVVNSFGVFLVVFVDVFNTGRGMISWVGCLLPAVTLTAGPLASALTNKFGCRRVTIVGSLIAGCGFVLSTVAPNLYFLYFSSGIMAGLGFGLMYLPAIVGVAQYFEKRRSFAMGLAVCGTGFGTFIMAPLNKFLLSEYGWRGALLIVGGFLFNIVVCGAVYRPLEPSAESSNADDTEEPEKGVNDGKGFNSLRESEAQILIDAPEMNGDGKILVTFSIAEDEDKRVFDENTNLITVGPISDHRGSDCSDCELRGYNTRQNCLIPLSDQHSVDLRSISSQHFLTPRSELSWVDLRSNCSHSHLPPCSELSRIDLRSNGSHNYLAPPGNGQAVSNESLHRIRGSISSESPAHSRLHSTHGSVASFMQPVGRKDVFYRGSLQNIPMYRSYHDEYIESMVLPTTIEEDADGRVVSPEFSGVFRQMLSFSLLKNPVFLMFGISNFLTFVGFNTPYIFLPDRAVMSGIDESKSAWLLSVIGIFNMVGGGIFGFLADRQSVNRLMLYSTALTVCGVVTALSPFLGGNYVMLMTYAAVFGSLIVVNGTLISIILVDLLGIDLLTNSFGLLLLFQGAASFIGPPIAGWICDLTGNYDISFHVMGAVIAASGSMLYFLPWVQRSYEKRTPRAKTIHQIQLGKHTSDPDIMQEAEMQMIEEAERIRKSSRFSDHSCVHSLYKDYDVIPEELEENANQSDDPKRSERSNELKERNIEAEEVNTETKKNG